MRSIDFEESNTASIVGSNECTVVIYNVSLDFAYMPQGTW